MIAPAPDEQRTVGQAAEEVQIECGQRHVQAFGDAPRRSCGWLTARAALPIGIGTAAPAFGAPLLLGAGIGIGISSSVIPYVCDQLAMSRLPRATFALLLSLLPATATPIGFLVLR